MIISQVSYRTNGPLVVTGRISCIKKKKSVSRIIDQVRYRVGCKGKLDGFKLEILDLAT